MRSQSDTVCRGAGLLMTGLLTLAAGGLLPTNRAAGVDLRVGPDEAIKTLPEVRDEIRSRRANGEWISEPINIKLALGRHTLTEPLILGPQDGGKPEAPVTYMCESSAPAGISGAQEITEWEWAEVNGRRFLVADLPEVRSGKWYFRQLFIKDQRRPRARLPREGFLAFTGLPELKPDTAWNVGQTQASFKPGDLRADWRNPVDIDIVALHFWVESRLGVKAIDAEKNLVQFAGPSVFRLTAAHDPAEFAPYYVENVFETLSEPGQWYLDRAEGRLYVLPRPGESPKRLVALAPRLTQLIRVVGDEKLPVTDIRFVGLRFAHSDWYWPAGKAGSAQAAVEVPGAVYFEKAERCELRECVVGRMSNYGVEIGAGCRDIRLINNLVTDLGGGGIKVGHGSSRTTIHNNEISDGGKLFHSAVGVWIGNSGENTVTHNEIHDFYYTGVSVGWTWGYGASNAINNKIEYNHIYRIGKGWLSDMAGIYTLGVSPGTTLRFNHIHDVNGSRYGGWGLYNDEGSTGILLENNVVYRTTHGGYHQHYGKENIVRNNIFAFARDTQVVRTREEEHVSFTFEHNIVYFDKGVLLGSNWTNNQFKMDYNLYWRVGGQPFDFAGGTFDAWKARGHDIHSVIGDPRFMEPARGDFRLRPDSPAPALGFKPFDIRMAGRLR